MNQMDLPGRTRPLHSSGSRHVTGSPSDNRFPA
jgi:hypothetical protein